MTQKKSNRPSDFIDALITLQKECKVHSIKLSEFGIQSEDFPKFLQNARDPKEQRGVYLGAQNMIVLGLSISPVLCGYLLKEATASMMFAVLCVILVFSLAFYQMGYSVSEKAETI